MCNSHSESDDIPYLMLAWNSQDQNSSLTEGKEQQRFYT